MRKPSRWDALGWLAVFQFGMFILFVLGIALLSSCTTVTTKYVCPSLSPVPNSTLDVLESQGRKDPNTAAWVVDLDKHYQKLDVCKP